MYGYMIYPIYPPLPPSYSVYPSIEHLQRSPYPKVDTKIFQSSVKSFRYLMEQGSLLLDQLGDSRFATKVMDAAQQGKKAQVDNLIKSIGLKVFVTTKYNPTGIIFTLHSQPPQALINCCTLTISMQWGT